MDNVRSDTVEKIMTCSDCLYFDACAQFWYSDYDTTPSLEATKARRANQEPCLVFKSKADMAELRHGEWVADDKFDNGKSSIFHCSECYYSRSTSVLYTAERLAVDDPYCKKCGAKMDGKVLHT